MVSGKLAGYRAVVSSAAGAVLRLQKSADAVVWDDVTSSQLQVQAGVGEVTKALGVGSTVSDNSTSRGGSGFRHYRLLVDGDAVVEEVRFGPARLPHLPQRRARRLPL